MIVNNKTTRLLTLSYYKMMGNSLSTRQLRLSPGSNDVKDTEWESATKIPETGEYNRLTQKWMDNDYIEVGKKAMKKEKEPAPLPDTPEVRGNHIELIGNTKK